MTKILIGRGDTDLDYPICRPSLDLDFTQEELDPRITFTRGSTGTRVNRNRVIETVDANQPRFDYDPVTGECKGLLIEESRVNSWLYSGQSVTTGWGFTPTTLSFDNTQTAPDGSTNTIKFTERAVYTGGMGFNQTLSVTSGTSYTFSVFAKQPDNSPLRYFSILFYNTGFTTFQIVTFDPKNGTVLYNSAGNTTFIQKYPNGWWRFGVTATATATTTSSFQIRFTNSVTSSTNPPYGYGGPYGNYTGDGSSYLYFFGPQVENGAFMTSFIPTSASTVTRSADTASMSGTNFSSWYNQTEGTFYISGNASYVFQRSFGASIFNNASFADNRISIRMGNTFIRAGAEQFAVYPQASKNNWKLSFGLKQNDIMFVLDGTKFTADKNATLPTNLDTLEICKVEYTNSLYTNGTLSRLTYYPRRLKDNQLQLLTQ